jgi:hypothetical protein
MECRKNWVLDTLLILQMLTPASPAVALMVDLQSCYDQGFGKILAEGVWRL